MFVKIALVAVGLAATLLAVKKIRGRKEITEV
jgi:hypothetical protein